MGNNFTTPDPAVLRQEIATVKHWIDLCAILGAPHIRFFAGEAAGISVTQARQLAIASLEECSEYAGARGIMLGVENHHGIVAEPDGLIGSRARGPDHCGRPTYQDAQPWEDVPLRLAKMKSAFAR